MTILDPNEFEKMLAVPSLEDTDDLPTLVQHISIISDAIDKCEKILQHIAVGNFSDDFQRYMSMHVHLIGQRNALITKKEKLEKETANNNAENQALTDTARKSTSKNLEPILLVSIGVVITLIITVLIFASK